MPRAALGDALCSTVDEDSIFLKLLDITTNPISLSLTKFAHDSSVDHGGVHENAFVCRREVFKIPIEKFAEKKFGDDGEESLLAENVEAQKDIDDQVAGNYPFIGTREDGYFGSFLGKGELESLDS